MRALIFTEWLEQSREVKREFERLLGEGITPNAASEHIRERDESLAGTLRANMQAWRNELLTMVSVIDDAASPSCAAEDLLFEIEEVNAKLDDIGHEEGGGSGPGDVGSENPDDAPEEANPFVSLVNQYFPPVVGAEILALQAEFSGRPSSMDPQPIADRVAEELAADNWPLESVSATVRRAITDLPLAIASALGDECQLANAFADADDWRWHRSEQDIYERLFDVYREYWALALEGSVDDLTQRRLMDLLPEFAHLPVICLCCELGLAERLPTCTMLHAINLWCRLAAGDLSTIQESKATESNWDSLLLSALPFTDCAVDETNFRGAWWDFVGGVEGFKCGNYFDEVFLHEAMVPYFYESRGMHWHAAALQWGLVTDYWDEALQIGIVWEILDEVPELLVAGGDPREALRYIHYQLVADELARTTDGQTEDAIGNSLQICNEDRKRLSMLEEEAYLSITDAHHYERLRDAEKTVAQEMPVVWERSDLILQHALATARMRWEYELGHDPGQVPFLYAKAVERAWKLGIGRHEERDSRDSRHRKLAPIIRSCATRDDRAAFLFVASWSPQQREFLKSRPALEVINRLWGLRGRYAHSEDVSVAEVERIVEDLQRDEFLAHYLEAILPTVERDA